MACTDSSGVVCRDAGRGGWTPVLASRSGETAGHARSLVADAARRRARPEPGRQVGGVPDDRAGVRRKGSAIGSLGRAGRRQRAAAPPDVHQVRRERCGLERRQPAHCVLGPPRRRRGEPDLRARSRPAAAKRSASRRSRPAPAFPALAARRQGACSSPASSTRTPPDEAANKQIAAERKEPEVQRPRVRQLSRALLGSMARRSTDPRVRAEPRAGQRSAVDLLAGTRLVQSPGYGGRRLDAGEELDPVWAPDGSSIVFAATTNRNASAYSTDAHAPLSGCRDRRRAEAADATERQLRRPRFRPDGRALVLHRAPTRTTRSTRSIVWRWRRGPGRASRRRLTASFDRSVASWAFTPDSRSIYLTAEDAGLEKVYVVPAQGGETTLADRAATRRVHQPRHRAARKRRSLVADWGSAIEPGGDRANRSGDETAHASDDVSPWTRRPRSTGSRPSTSGSRARAGGRIHSMIVRPPGFDSDPQVSAARRDPRRRSPACGAIRSRCDGTITCWRSPATWCC